MSAAETYLEGRQRERQEREKASATVEFEKWRWALSLAGWGYRLPAFRAIQEALQAIGEQRRTSGYRGLDYETETVAVRVLGRHFANEVQAAATDEHDPATIAWVIAGLRCPAQPFCTGCSSCFTIAAPIRPNEAPNRSRL